MNDYYPNFFGYTAADYATDRAATAPTAGNLYNADNSGRWALGRSASRNPDPFRRGPDSKTAFETRKKAKRIYAPAAAALATQNELLDPTLALTRRAAEGYGSLYRDEADKSRQFLIDSLRTYGPEWMKAYAASNPETADLLHSLTRDASDLVNGGGDPYEDHLTEQSIRGAQAARGMGYGQTDAMAEVLGLDRSREQRRIARGTYGAGIVGLGQNYYGGGMAALLGIGPQGSSIQSPVQGTPTEDLLSMSLNDTMQRRNMQQATRARNAALVGAGISAIGSLAGGSGGSGAVTSPTAVGGGGGGGYSYGGAAGQSGSFTPDWYSGGGMY